MEKSTGWDSKGTGVRQEPSDESDEFRWFREAHLRSQRCFHTRHGKGVVSDTCSCLVEQLLNGYKVQFGELGIFSISITCEPAATLKDFSSDNIKAVNILFNPGIDFENLRSKAEFNLVTSRAIQAASLKAVKENKDTVDLAALKKGDSESPDEI